jgi:hypothetical protein
MKTTSKPFALKMVFSVSFLFLSLFLASNILASNIQGIVYDRQRNALADIDIELLNDYYQVIKRTRTEGSGRYQFDGLSDGRYTVKALAFRYDLEDQEMPVEISTQGVSVSSAQGGGSSIGQGNGTFIQDFYLSPKKGGLRDSELGVVFAQDVPKEAKKSYDLALDDFKAKRADAGFTNLKKSIELFPTYYQALMRFGAELFSRRQYLDSAQVYMKAAEVNPKSALSFFYVGYALHNLGKQYNKSALKALTMAQTLAPVSPQVLWLLGKVERAEGKTADAEKHLLAAKKQATTPIPEVHMELSQLYANDLKKYKEAADELELYLKASKAEKEEEKKTKKIIADLREKAKQQVSSK